MKKSRSNGAGIKIVEILFPSNRQSILLEKILLILEDFFGVVMIGFLFEGTLPKSLGLDESSEISKKFISTFVFYNLRKRLNNKARDYLHMFCKYN